MYVYIYVTPSSHTHTLLSIKTDVGTCTGPTLLCISAALATLFHDGSSGREQALHMMSSSLIMRLDVVVKVSGGMTVEEKK